MKEAYEIAQKTSGKQRQRDKERQGKKIIGTIDGRRSSIGEKCGDRRTRQIEILLGKRNIQSARTKRRHRKCSIQHQKDRTRKRKNQNCPPKHATTGKQPTTTTRGNEGKRKKGETQRNSMRNQKQKQKSSDETSSISEESGLEPETVQVLTRAGKQRNEGRLDQAKQSWKNAENFRILREKFECKPKINDQLTQQQKRVNIHEEAEASDEITDSTNNVDKPHEEFEEAEAGDEISDSVNTHIGKVYEELEETEAEANDETSDLLHMNDEEAQIQLIQAKT